MTCVRKLLTLPTEKQIKGGDFIASLLYEASIDKCFSEDSDYSMHSPIAQEVVSMYLAEEIDSVTGIYMYMQSLGD